MLLSKCLLTQKDSKVPLKDCQEHLREVDKKRRILFHFIKAVMEEEGKDVSEEKSSLPVLSETYVSLLRVGDLLTKVITLTPLSAKQVTFSPENASFYYAYYLALNAYEHELKHLHNISLFSELQN